ncbi:chaperone modulator CbpM [Pedobacter panaciterrae]
MKKQTTISVEQCCHYYQIEISFVQQLNEHDLIKFTRSGNSAFIHYEQLADLEKFIHLHYDLEINIEGIETVMHLLNRVDRLQQKIKELQNNSEQS